MEGLADFYLAATMRQESGPAQSEMGLVFRLDSENSRYYLFEINNDGQFALFLRQADWETLLDWQPAPAVRAGMDNRLAVVAQGQEFLLAVNEQVVGRWQDERLPTGQAGVLIGLPSAGDQGNWTFDDFELRAPE